MSFESAFVSGNWPERLPVCRLCDHQILNTDCFGISFKNGVWTGQHGSGREGDDQACRFYEHQRKFKEVV